MNKQYKIAMIGAGNVGWHLAKELEKAGHVICSVFSQQEEHALKLQKQLYSAEIASGFNYSGSRAEVYILCIKDDAVAEVARLLTLPPNAILLHTSGSLPLDILREAGTEKTGVFYPLQTFSKHKKVDFTHVPLCIEAANHHVLPVLQQIGKSISQQVYEISSTDRSALHVAAVLACNFSNHLWAMADAILEDRELPLQLLQPLIKETLDKALSKGPANSQTGPAKRNDQHTIARHIQFLEDDYPEWVKVYRALTGSIQEFNK